MLVVGRLRVPHGACRGAEAAILESYRTKTSAYYYCGERPPVWLEPLDAAPATALTPQWVPTSTYDGTCGDQFLVCWRSPPGVSWGPAYRTGALDARGHGLVEVASPTLLHPAMRNAADLQLDVLLSPKQRQGPGLGAFSVFASCHFDIHLKGPSHARYLHHPFSRSIFLPVRISTLSLSGCRV
jgi:hypothetical protein